MPSIESLRIAVLRLIHRRRTANKRRLSALLREHGIPKALSKSLVRAYFHPQEK